MYFSSDDEYFEDEYIYGDGTLDEDDEDEENRSVISDTPVVTMTDMDDHETRPRAASEGGSPCGSLEKDVSGSGIIFATKLLVLFIWKKGQICKIVSK